MPEDKWKGITRISIFEFLPSAKNAKGLRYYASCTCGEMGAVDRKSWVDAMKDADAHILAHHSPTVEEPA